MPANSPPPRGVIDVAIVGAGVMGAMLAERLSAAGRQVALFDRRPPSWGATAASTALVMWAADTPLSHLAASVGLAEAGRRWRRVRQAVLDISARIEVLDLQCGWTSRLEVYLDGDVLDESGLIHEAAARREAGLPSNFCDGPAIEERFGVASRPGLVSADAFEVDPVALTLGMLRAALDRGASLTYPAEVTAVIERDDRVQLSLGSGEIIEARHAILACGAATFGSSPDGLPAIGKSRAHERLWLACGFGGNGVTFASLAAGIIAAAFDGAPDPAAPGFCPYRFEAR